MTKQDKEYKESYETFIEKLEGVKSCVIEKDLPKDLQNVDYKELVRLLDGYKYTESNIEVIISAVKNSTKDFAAILKNFLEKYKEELTNYQSDENWDASFTVNEGLDFLLEKAKEEYRRV